jgi:hypothetical protein
MLKYLCAPLALLALAAAGCGGGGGPSKKEYISSLDKVCKRSNEKIQKVKAPKNVKEIGTFTRATRPILEGSIKEAEDLKLPKEDGNGFKAYIQGSKRSLSELDAMEKAADSGDAATVRRVFAKTARENQKRDVQAKKLGLKACGSG